MLSGMDVRSLLTTGAVPREWSGTATAGVGVGGTDAFQLIIEIGFICNVEILTSSVYILMLGKKN